MQELTKLIAVALRNSKGAWKIHWLNVTPAECLTRFKVGSEHGNTVRSYLVDLMFYWGIGKCGCPHFAIHLEPVVSRWRADERQITDEFRCKHQRAARMYLGEELLDRYLVACVKEARKTRHEL